MLFKSKVLAMAPMLPNGKTILFKIIVAILFLFQCKLWFQLREHCLDARGLSQHIAIMYIRLYTTCKIDYKLVTPKTYLYL